MVKFKKVAASFLLAGLCTGGSAFADDGNASTAANGQKGLFELNSGETMCRGQWSFSTYYNMWDRGVTSVPGERRLTIWDAEIDRWSAAVGYGVTDRFEVSLMLPHWSYEAQNERGGARGGLGYLNGRYYTGGRIDQSGLGDLRLGGKLQIYRSPNSALALTAFVDLPTGDEDESVVTGSTGYGAGLAYGNDSGWVINVGYQVPGDSDFSDDTAFGDVANELHGGIGYAYDISPRFQWITELSGIAYHESPAYYKDAADLATGARFRFGNPDWALNAAVRLSDRGEVGGLAGISYAPRNRFLVVIEKPNAVGADGREYPGVGTVRSADGQIDCGGMCEAKFRCGDTLTLTAAADANSRFVGWTGACGGDVPQVSLTVGGEDLNCGATFIRQYDVAAQVGFKKHPDEGFVDGAGNVVMSYTGGPGTGSKECSTRDCKAVTERVDGGASVTFEARPEARSTVEWSGDCAGKTGSSVTLVADKNLSCGVTFVGPPPVKANLGLQIRGTGSGAIRATPASRDNVSSCSGDCTLRYIGAEAVAVKLEAVAASGSTFTGWAGACSGTATGAPVLMDVDKTCIAIFANADSNWVACGGRGKKAPTEAASCDTRVEAISFSGSELTNDFWPTKRNGGKPKKGTLCEIAETLAQCPDVQACIVGSNDGGDPAARAESIRRFFGSQHDFLNLGWDRYRVSEDCGTGPAASGVGATVVIEKVPAKP